MIPTSHYVTTNGIRLHYLEWGTAGMPLVLLHGTTFCGLVWKPIAEALAGRYRVLTPDMRGHGDSDKPEHGYTSGDFTRDILGFLDALGLEQALLGGHSFGASVAAMTAQRQPKRFPKLLLIEPPFRLLPEHMEFVHRAKKGFTERSERRAHVWPDRDAMFRVYREKPNMKTWREDVLQAYIEGGTSGRPDGQVELKCPPHVELQLHSRPPGLELTADQVRELTMPALVIRGERTPRGLRSMVESGVALLPRCRYEIVAEGTHFVPMDRPDEVARIMRQFLEDGS
jgi:pimeloyl-ACP methyl ester carboxylesterase